MRNDVVTYELEPIRRPSEVAWRLLLEMFSLDPRGTGSLAIETSDKSCLKIERAVDQKSWSLE
jgi:hypothetical protein